jgi:lipopolysaccharide transport system ATP-binding protein
MGDVAKEGRTVLFVSHNMAAIETLCKRVLLLRSGQLAADGPANVVINDYLTRILPLATSIPLSARTDRSGSGTIRFIGFSIQTLDGKPTAALRSGHDAVFAFEYQTHGDFNSQTVDVGFSFFSTKGQLLFVLYSSYVGQEFKLIPRRGTFYCRVRRFPLAPGRYRVGARIVVGGEEADWPVEGIGYVDVEAGDFYGTGRTGFMRDCPLLVDGSWEVNEEATRRNL